MFEGSKDIKRDFICVADVVEIHKRFFEIDESGNIISQSYTVDLTYFAEDYVADTVINF